MTPLVLLPMVIVLVVLLMLITNGLRFDALVRGEVEDLLRASAANEPAVVTEEDLRALPGPVRRYLEYTGTLGCDLPRTVRIEQEGAIRLRPDGRWLRFTAEQHYSTDPVAFVWSARVKMGPLTLMRAMDCYKEGRGHMVGKLMSTFTVVDGIGKEMDHASLTRFLNEMMWFPSVYLSDRIRWEGIDERTTRATMEDGGMVASATLHFDGEGRLVDFTCPRYRSTDSGFVMDSWATPIEDYGTFDGRRLPAVGSAVWKLDTGDFEYIRIKLTQVKLYPR